VILVDKEERALRLQKKLEHWIAHNKEHAESFRKAAREAEEVGLVEVGSRLNEAATRMEEIASVLEGAKNELD
jgi:ferric-dicitrate binding protein FerR (iron transport regulator)